MKKQMLAMVIMVSLLAAACEGGKVIGRPPPKTTTTTSAPTSTTSTTSTSSTTSTTTSTTLVAPSSTTTSTTSTTSTTIPTTTTVIGSAACGLTSAAFCGTVFSPTKFAVARSVGEVSAQDLMPFPNVPVSSCKAGVTVAVPDNEILNCDSASGHGGQFLTALGAQNYGLLSLRARQQFDFAGRTGKISYNVDAITRGNGSWWTSVAVTDDPAAGPSDSAQVTGLLPRNGLRVNFDQPCFVGDNSKVSVGNLFVYNNYVETRISNDSPTCVNTQRGSLNHIEIHLSQTKIEVWATDAGSSILKKIFESSINLSISRGYVHFQQAERAPAKYETQANITPTYANNYWSNLAFDGPVVGMETGYTAPNALTQNSNGKGTNIGYALTHDPYAPAAFTFNSVNVTGVTKAELSFLVAYTYLNEATPSTVTLRYSINGGPLQTPSTPPNLIASQACSGCPGPTGGGGVLYNFPIAVADLRSGSNSVMIAVDNTVNSWPAILSSLELITH